MASWLLICSLMYIWYFVWRYLFLACASYFLIFSFPCSYGDNFCSFAAWIIYSEVNAPSSYSLVVLMLSAAKVELFESANSGNTLSKGMKLDAILVIIKFSFSVISYYDVFRSSYELSKAIWFWTSLLCNLSLNWLSISP